MSARGWLRAFGAVAAVGAACVTYGVAIERTAFRVRRANVPVLPEGSRPIRVLHFLDAHLLPRQGRKRDFPAGLGWVGAGSGGLDRGQHQLTGRH